MLCGSIVPVCIAPPPPPVVYSTNTSVCFWSRSPVESYLVTVTDSCGTDTSLSGTYNTSQCLPIPSDLSPDVCGPFMASVVAVNGIGTSSETAHLTIIINSHHDIEMKTTNFDGMAEWPQNV